MNRGNSNPPHNRSDDDSNSAVVDRAEAFMRRRRGFFHSGDEPLAPPVPPPPIPITPKSIPPVIAKESLDDADTSDPALPKSSDTLTAHYVEPEVSLPLDQVELAKTVLPLPPKVPPLRFEALQEPSPTNSRPLTARLSTVVNGGGPIRPLPKISDLLDHEIPILNEVVDAFSKNENLIAGIDPSVLNILVNELSDNIGQHITQKLPEMIQKASLTTLESNLKDGILAATDEAAKAFIARRQRLKRLPEG